MCGAQGAIQQGWHLGMSSGIWNGVGYHSGPYAVGLIITRTMRRSEHEPAANQHNLAFIEHLCVYLGFIKT